VTVEGCQVHDNAATSGGGIYLSGSTNSLLENNSVHDNTAAGRSGGGVRLSSAIPVLALSSRGIAL
jgi:parallel beta-helix repeat protein